MWHLIDGFGRPSTARRCLLIVGSLNRQAGELLAEPGQYAPGAPGAGAAVQVLSDNLAARDACWWLLQSGLTREERRGVKRSLKRQRRLLTSRSHASQDLLRNLAAHCRSPRRRRALMRLRRRLERHAGLKASAGRKLVSLLRAESACARALHQRELPEEAVLQRRLLTAWSSVARQLKETPTAGRLRRRLARLEQWLELLVPLPGPSNDTEPLEVLRQARCQLDEYCWLRRLERGKAPGIDELADADRDRLRDAAKAGRKLLVREIRERTPVRAKEIAAPPADKLAWAAFRAGADWVWDHQDSWEHPELPHTYARVTGLVGAPEVHPEALARPVVDFPLHGRLNAEP